MPFIPLLLHFCSLTAANADSLAFLCPPAPVTPSVLYLHRQNDNPQLMHLHLHLWWMCFALCPSLRHHLPFPSCFTISISIPWYEPGPAQRFLLVKRDFFLPVLLWVSLKHLDTLLNVTGAFERKLNWTILWQGCGCVGVHLISPSQGNIWGLTMTFFFNDSFWCLGVNNRKRFDFCSKWGEWLSVI